MVDGNIVKSYLLLILIAYEATDGNVACKENFEVVDEQKKSLTFNLFDEDVSQ